MQKLLLMKNYQNKLVEPLPKEPAFKNARVTDYMTPLNDLITFRPETHIMEVVRALLKHEITGAPILNDKKELVGVIDDKDCLQLLLDSAYFDEPVNNTVARFTTNVMKTIPDHMTIFDVADMFLNTKYKRLLVLDEDGKLVGQISRQDVLRAINRLGK